MNDIFLMEKNQFNPLYRLKLLCLLIDARVGIREIDHVGVDFYEKHAIPYQVSIYT
jgi:GTP-binding protein EngB required for normal cell division